MKKTLLLIIAIANGLISFGQSQLNNLNIGLSNNGANGSNAGSGAYIEVALRPVTGTYTGVPAAEDFGVILRAPKENFELSDAVNIVEVNSSLFGGTATTLMIPQAVVDAGDDYLYFPIALNSAAGLNLSSLAINTLSFAFTLSFNNPKTAAQIKKVVLVDQINNTTLSAFIGSTVFTYLNIGGANQLTTTGFTALPVNLLNFSGYKNGNKNTLHWTTAGESNNRGFEVQRSMDGVNYSAIGFVNSMAPSGSSNTQQSYTFDDNSRPGKKQYYRLRQVDMDNRSRLSNIVIISGDNPLVLSIGALFPNPARTQVNVIIYAPTPDRVTLIVSDINGKIIKQQMANVETGSNTVAIEISNLAKAGYIVKLVCQSSYCGKAVGKFIKE